MFISERNKIKMKLYVTKRLHKWQKVTALTSVAVAVIATVGMSVIPRQMAKADSVGDQIQQLQQQNAANQNAVAQLQNEAVSFQDAVARLNSQINLVQGQIADNTARQATLQDQINANQAELVKQKSILGESIRVMYVEGQISTIEMLATSKNLSDFVDKEEYHTTIENKIQDTLKRINDIQNQLKEQKTQVERLLAEQQSQHQQLANSRAEQGRLLAFNESQQSAYNKQTAANQAKISSLIAAQRRANNTTDGGYYFLRFKGAIRGFNPANYPYKNAGFGMSTAPGCVDNDGPDEWGYCTRQCVSYAAWAVEASGRSAPRYYGNAKQWVSAAYAHSGDVTVSRVPQPGDIAISTSGTWGHAMYVEQVEASRIYVSQYNQGLDGEFSYQWRNY